MGDRYRAKECSGDVVVICEYELEAYAVEGLFYGPLPRLALWPPPTAKPHNLCQPSMMLFSNQLGRVAEGECTSFVESWYAGIGRGWTKPGRTRRPRVSTGFTKKKPVFSLRVGRTRKTSIRLR